MKENNGDKSSLFKAVKAFTLAELLVTLLLVGTAAMLIIPSIYFNGRKLGFRSGYTKAVVTINDAVAHNISKGKKTPKSTEDLAEYLASDLEVTSASDSLDWMGQSFKTFTTEDNTRYLFAKDDSTTVADITLKSHHCGSDTTGNYTPCILIVDTNGDKLPNEISDDSVSDAFFIMVTDSGAFPYGTIGEDTYYKGRLK